MYNKYDRMEGNIHEGSLIKLALVAISFLEKNKINPLSHTKSKLRQSFDPSVLRQFGAFDGKFVNYTDYCVPR